MAALGSLVVSLGLDAATFTAGLTKAQYQARQFGQQLGEGSRDAAALAVASLATTGTSSPFELIFAQLARRIPIISAKSLSSVTHQ